MSVLRRCSGENTLILTERNNPLYWLVLIIPFLALSVMDVKKACGKIKEARRNPAVRADALNLGLSVYALIVCTVLMILMMLGVVG